MADPGLNGPIVIAGAGLAGGTAALTLRAEGFRDRLLLIGDEPGLPFGRPPLSKTYLRGEEDLDGWIVKPDRWYREQDVELIHDTAVSVDPEARTVRLGSGRDVGYWRLLVATGGRNRRLDIPGAELAGVFQLRTVAGCDALRAASKPGSHAVLVGMGFIGCEVAASLCQMGLRVTAILPGKLPLAAVLGDPVAEVIAAVHREAGVEMVAGDEATRLEGEGRVERVVTRNGRSLDCDLVVVAVGIEPNSELLAGTGIETDNGVLVDEFCRTSDPAVFAAGDVANHAHPLFGRLRVEHYNNAEKQGAAAARAMLGAAGPYDVVHSFWSDQYQHKLEYVGHSRSWDRFVVRGSLEEKSFVGFYLEGGRLAAAVGFNRGGDPEVDKDGELAVASRLIGRRASPSEAELRDGALED